MKKLCASSISILLLNFSLIMCCLTEPTCFWRIKNSEDNDVDLRNDCGFYLWTHEGPIEDNLYNDIIYFR